MTRCLNNGIEFSDKVINATEPNTIDTTLFLRWCITNKSELPFRITDLMMNIENDSKTYTRLQGFLSDYRTNMLKAREVVLEELKKIPPTASNNYFERNKLCKEMKEE